MRLREARMILMNPRHAAYATLGGLSTYTEKEFVIAE
jgi:hypothetical protein